MKVVCQTCKKARVRFIDIYSPRNCLRHINREGNRWLDASTCPECWRIKKEKRKRSVNRRQRKLRKELISDVVKLEKYHLTRKCRRCAGPVEMSRYFTCSNCSANNNFNEDFIYHVV